MGDFKDNIFKVSPIPWQPSWGYAMADGNHWLYHQGARAVWKWQAQRTCTITALGFCVVRVWHMPPIDPQTGERYETPQYRICIEGLDSEGLANGIEAGGGNFRPETDWTGYKWKWKDINNVPVVRGAYYAIVLKYNSGYISIYNSMIISAEMYGGNGLDQYFPGYGQSGLSGNIPIFALKDTDGNVYGYPCQFAFGGFDSDWFVYPEEQALAFNIPSSHCSYYKIAGVQYTGAPTEIANTSHSIVLYGGEEGQERLGRMTLQRGHHGYLGPYNSDVQRILFDEPNLATLYPDQTYYLAVSPNDPSGGVYLDHFHTTSEQLVRAWPGGDNFWMAWRTAREPTYELNENGEYVLVGGHPERWQELPEYRPAMTLIISEWGAPYEEEPGVHLKFTPKWNDNVFIQHADDQIGDNPQLEEGQLYHEQVGYPIGDAIESYSGYLTVQVFLDPDEDRSPGYVLIEEQEIEKVKTIRLQPWEAGVYQVVFRLRAAKGSSYYREIIRYLRVIINE